MNRDSITASEESIKVGNVKDALTALPESSEGDLLYWHYINWLAAAGFIREAEDRLRQARGGLAEKLLLRLWTAYAVFDPRILSEVRQFIRHPDCVDEVRKSLRLLYFSEGFTETLLKDYQNVVKTFTGTEKQRLGILADFASLCAANGYNDHLLALESLPSARLSIHLDRYLLNNEGSEVCLKFNDAKARQFTGAIDAFTDEIWQTLSDPMVSRRV